MNKPNTLSRREAMRWIGSLAAASTLPAALPAWAQAKYPDQLTKLIVALPAGGSVDMIARALAQRLQTASGQPWIVDNRGGGSGQIGMPAVARAAPDGYTLTVSPASFLTTNKSVFKKLPYDPEADFAPISRLVNQPMVLVVKDRQKFPTVAALVSAARAAPGTVTYASSGDGSPQHLAGLMFESRTQTKLLHVPYRGGSLAINDTIGGQVDVMFAVMPEAVSFVQTGRLQALGVMSPKRSPTLPQVPTMAEAGVADLHLSAWMALLAPAKTPRAIIDQLNRAVSTAFDAELRAKLAESGIEVATSTPEELQQLIAHDIKLHAELVKAAGLVPQ
ncbi:tripartite tricarboxylate transporter substrate binding protein [Aquincola sp. MAHUQ-54]|uniref:Tripartite tricarboxylate transporter substrate binding protein n=1 Tax=Aquincola agrisoli TaxID=3119538 RepID=A0AAW9Q9G8_9BURK